MHVFFKAAKGWILKGCGVEEVPCQEGFVKSFLEFGGLPSPKWNELPTPSFLPVYSPQRAKELTEIELTCQQETSTSSLFWMPTYLTLPF